LEEGRFLIWQAVACKEQGIPLTATQKKALGDLLSFNDDEDVGRYLSAGRHPTATGVLPLRAL
jgi:hypothetical protein